MLSALGTQKAKWCRRGPRAVGEGEVVHAALAVHPGGRDLRVGVVALGVLGQAEAELGVEVEGGLHVRREAVEMVDALRMRAPLYAAYCCSMRSAWSILK